MIPKSTEEGYGRNPRQEERGNNIGSDLRISSRYFEILQKKCEEFLASVPQTDIFGAVE